MMNFLQPWYLLGLAAVVLPVAVHYLTRPRPRRLPLSTIRFVREAVQQKRARHRLRDLIILTLRTAAICLIVWAFARPLIGARPPEPQENGNRVRIVVLDQSQSMAAVSNGVWAFERARAAAGRRLSFEPGLSADLILAGARPRATFPSPSSNFAAMQAALSPAAPLSETLNLKAAIDLAGDMLARASKSAQRELWVISDFQRSNWTSADFSPLPTDTRVHLESVAPAQPPENLAILRVGAQGRAEQGREVRLEADVGNYSQSPRDVRVEVSVAGASYRLEGHCPPGVRTTLSASALLPQAGWQAGEARLLDVRDALAADNMRPFVVHVHPPVVYALLTRDSPEPHPSSSHFLERALVPDKALAGRPAERVIRLDPAALDRDMLSTADLIVLDHPGRLSNEAIKQLWNLMRLGRGVLYVACEAADASNLGVLTGQAGADLRMPVEFVPAQGRPREDTFIASTRSQDAPFRAFGDQLAAGLAPLRFNGGLDSRRVNGGLTDDVLASYGDQSACLVVTRCAAGTLAVLNVDLSQSNLVASPMFVPLMSELTARLLSRTSGQDEIASGQMFVKELPPDAGPAAALSVAGPPRSNAALGTLIDSDSGAVWRWPEAGPPGVYMVRHDQTPVYAVASTIPTEESDLTPMDMSVLKDRLAGGRSVLIEDAGASAPGRDTGWSWIAVACVSCMLTEIAALKFFRT